LRELVSVAEAGFVILSAAKDLNMAQILRFAQNDMGGSRFSATETNLVRMGAGC
jgi:hypothetical protein